MFRPRAAKPASDSPSDRVAAIAHCVEERVMAVIGTPVGFRRVEARVVYEDCGVMRMRVNVLVDATKESERIVESTRIARSFFIWASMGGLIERSEPELRKGTNDRP